MVSQKWGVKPAFKEKRQSKHKRHFDELAEDSRLTGAEDCFRVNVFYAMLDIVNTQMKQRFAAMLAVTEKFAVLNQAVLSENRRLVLSYAEGEETARRLPLWYVIGVSSSADLLQSLNEDWNWQGDVC